MTFPEGVAQRLAGYSMPRFQGPSGGISTETVWMRETKHPGSPHLVVHTVGREPRIANARVNSRQEPPQASLRRHLVQPRCRPAAHGDAYRGQWVVRPGLAFPARSAGPEDPEGVSVGSFGRMSTALGVLADSYAHQSVKMTSSRQHRELAINVPQPQIERLQKEDCPF